MPAWHSSVCQLGTAPGAIVELRDMWRLSMVGSAEIRRGSLLLELINGSKWKQTENKVIAPVTQTVAVSDHFLPGTLSGWLHPYRRAWPHCELGSSLSVLIARQEDRDSRHPTSLVQSKLPWHTCVCDSVHV